jgi:hypothetical protein
LTYQGFTSSSIQYLSANTTLDLNGDGTPDVSNDATNKNLNDAINGLINSGDTIGDVVLYLVDHGGSSTFRMSGSETLSSNELATSLTDLQNALQGNDRQTDCNL